jgi:hypothetical protein
MKTFARLALGLALLSTLTFTGGCTDAQMSKFGALGSRHRITLYSGGKQVGQWTSTGAISNEEHSDGFYFKDDATNKIVRLSGTAVIEQL